MLCARNGSKHDIITTDRLLYMKLRSSLEEKKEKCTYNVNYNIITIRGAVDIVCVDLLKKKIT
jgi:hypothetical protein